jgi:peptidoglycan biosynthesis protein MviN/MurJ (putative lipid II flippase)
VNYAWRLFYVFLTWGVALQVVSFTELSTELVGATSIVGRINSITTPLRAGLFSVIPLSLAAWLLRAPLVGAAYFRGRFDAASFQLTLAAFSAYSFTLLPAYLVGFLMRALFALGDARTAVVTAAVWAVTALVVDVVLLPTFGFISIPIGFAAGTTVASVAALYALERMVQTPLILPLARYACLVATLSGIAAMPLAVAVSIRPRYQGEHLTDVAVLFAAGLTSLALFVGLAAWNRVREIWPVLALLGFHRDSEDSHR